MNKQNIILLIINSFMYVSCEDLFDLEFADREVEVAEECKANLIESKSELEANLIGKWKIIAFSCESCQHEYDKREVTLEFFQDHTAIFTDRGSEGFFTWTIIELPSSSAHRLKIDVEPNAKTIEYIMLFCSRYMIREDEGFQVLWEKQ